MMAPETTTQTNQKSNTSVGVTVTTKTESTRIGEGLDLNPLYFKTIPGLIKIIQLILAILCMGCASPVVAGYTHFFMFVVATFFICTLLLCLSYFFTLKNLVPNVPCLTIELIATAAAVVLYALATIIQLAMSSRRDYHYALSFFGYYSPYIAAGVLALFNTVAYIAGLVFLYIEWRGTSRATTSPATNGNAS